MEAGATTSNSERGVRNMERTTFWASRNCVRLALCFCASVVNSARGQTQFHAELDGSQTVPPTPTTATGTCSGTLNAAETDFTFSCTHTVRDAIAGHIHRGTAGSVGDVVFAISESGCCPESSTWLLMPQDAADLGAGRLHVNIHSAQHATEAIRGQLLPEGGVVDSAVGGGGFVRRPMWLIRRRGHGDDVLYSVGREGGPCPMTGAVTWASLRSRSPTSRGPWGG